jgi:hypothetical protein
MTLTSLRAPLQIRNSTKYYSIRQELSHSGTPLAPSLSAFGFLTCVPPSEAIKQQKWRKARHKYGRYAFSYSLILHDF